MKRDVCGALIERKEGWQDRWCSFEGSNATLPGVVWPIRPAISDAILTPCKQQKEGKDSLIKLNEK